MTDAQLEELTRLRINLDLCETRLREAEMSVHRVEETVKEARLSIMLLVESAKSAQELQSAETGKHWIVGGIPS